MARWDSVICKRASLASAAASQASAGGIANLNMVSEGEAQISIAISSNVLQCLKGTDSFKGHAYEDLKVIGGLYMNPNQVVVTKKSGINTLAEIKGRHFAVAAAGSSVYNECANHFTTVGMKFPDDIRTELIAFGPAADITVRIPAEAGTEPRTVTLRVPEKDFVARQI